MRRRRSPCALGLAVATLLTALAPAARAQSSAVELFGVSAFGAPVTFCTPGVAFVREFELSERARMTWVAVGYAMSRASLVDDVAQFHCARAGRPDDAGGFGQLLLSNALSLALAAADFALAGWKARRPSGERVFVFLVPFTYPGFRGISAYGAGLRVVF